MKKIVISLIVLVSIGLIYFNVSKKSDRKPSPDFKSNRVNNKVFDELFKRAQKKDQSALTEALKYVDHASPFYREMTASILGFFKDDVATENLKKLMQDKNEKVKIRAFYALGNLVTPAREDLLIELIDNDSLNDRESVHLYTVLLRVTDSLETKEVCVDNLLYLLDNSKDKKTKNLASSALSQISKAGKKVIENFKKNIYNKNPIIAANIVRYFSASKNKWYFKNAYKFYSNKDLDVLVKVALIETMHLSCLANRTEYFKYYLNSKDKIIKQAVISQMVFHNNKPVKGLLENFLGQSGLLEVHKSKANEVLKKLSAKSSVDRCK